MKLRFRYNIYLGRIDMTRLDKIKAEEKFPILEQVYAIGQLWY